MDHFCILWMIRKPSLSFLVICYPCSLLFCIGLPCFTLSLPHAHPMPYTHVIPRLWKLPSQWRHTMSHDMNCPRFAGFPPSSRQAPTGLPGQDIFQGREIPPHDANVENEQRSHQQQQRKVHDPRGCWMVRVVPMAACIKAANIINNALI